MSQLSSKKYLMEDPREAGRLNAKVCPEEFIRTYLDPIILSKEGKSHQGGEMLDVGCGSGAITSALARTYKEWSVVGVDLNPARFNINDRCKNLEFRAANALNLPFRKGRFDLVYSRFLFEYMANPQRVISEMARVCKRGAVVLIQDLDGQLISNYPMRATFFRRSVKVMEFLKKKHFDPFVGRKLFYYSKKAGLKKITVQIEPYHLYAGRIDNKNYELWKLKLDIAKPHISKALGSTKAGSQFVRDFLKYLKEEDTLTFSLLFTVTGIKV